MDLGTFQAVFLALTQLNCTHIELKALQYHRGLLGMHKAFLAAINEMSQASIAASSICSTSGVPTFVATNYPPLSAALDR